MFRISPRVILLRSEKTCDKSRMRLPQLSKVIQDTYQTDKLMLFHQPYLVRPRQMSTSQGRLHFCCSHPETFKNLTILKLSLSRFKTTFYLLYHQNLITYYKLSPHIVCLDQHQSKLAYTKVMPEICTRSLACYERCFNCQQFSNQCHSVYIIMTSFTTLSHQCKHKNLVHKKAQYPDVYICTFVFFL